MSAATSDRLLDRRLKTFVRNVVEMQRPSPQLPVLALQDLESHTGRVLPSVDDRRVEGLVKRCEPGDVVFGKLRPYLAKATTVRAPMTVVGEFLVLRPTGVVPEYLEYVLRSAPFVHKVTALTAGAKMPRVEWTTLGGVAIPFVETHAQTSAVRFLRHAELRIAEAVAAKRRLLALMDDRRRAISLVLISGKHLPGTTRSSGVDWLGDVPAAWESRPAKWFYREVNERSERGNEQLMSVSHLTGVTPRAGKNVTMFMAASYAGHKLCRPGDLVINTMWAWMGALGVARATGIVSPAYGVYRPLPATPLDPDYADLLLRSRPYVDEYTCRSTGIRSSRLRLYPDRFLSIPVVCPPAEQQREIVDRVTDATRDLDAAIAATLREIELLQEYRVRLIADVIFAGRDVRGDAAALPDVDPADIAAALQAGAGGDDVDADDDGE